MPTTKATQRRDVSTEIAYLTRALKAPTLRESVSRLADQRPRRELEPRRIPGRLPAAGSVSPGVPWW